MSDTNTIPSGTIKKVFNTYQLTLRNKLLILRQLIHTTVAESNEIDALEETLKWGQPAYLTENGSTIRLGYKKSNPLQYAIYFHCQTTLIETFKQVYPDSFRYEGNRAMVFHIEDEIPVEELKMCIRVALTYHDRKELPMLGI